MDRTIEILKRLFIIHRIRKLSVHETIKMILNSSDGYKSMLQRVSKDYPSMEECIETLTAEALLEEQYSHFLEHIHD